MTMSRDFTSKILAATVCTLCAFSAPAQTSPERVAPTSIDIAAQPLSDALTELGKQTGMQVVLYSAVARQTTAGLKGTFTTEEALRRLLADTGLRHEYLDSRTVVILARAQESTSSGGAVAADNITPIRLAQQSAGQSAESRATASSGWSAENEVIVVGKSDTATKLELTLRETPQSMTVIDRQRIEAQNLTDINHVLNETVGVSWQNTGPVGADNNFSYARGFPLDNFQVDGVSRAPRFGFRHDVADMALYERVEVIRGASGLLSGEGDPSGVVNMVRKQPTRQMQSHVSGQYGSWEQYRMEGDLGGPVLMDGGIRARVVGAYQDSDSFVDRLSVEKKIFYGTLAAELTPATLLSVGVEYQNHETTGGGRFGTPILLSDGTPARLPRSANLTANWGYHEREDLSLHSTLKHEFDSGWLVRAGVEHVRREYDSVMPGVYAVNPDGSGDFYVERWSGKPEENSFNFHTAGPFTLFGRQHELVFGGSYSQLGNDPPGYTSWSSTVDALQFMRDGVIERNIPAPTGSRSESHVWYSGVFATARLKPADSVSILLGGRISNWKARTDRISAAGVVRRGRTTEKKSMLTPYVGVVVDVTDTISVYGSYTAIFKPGTQLDLNGELLEPAEGSNLEGGVKLGFFGDRLIASAAYFTTRKDNVAEYVEGPGGTVIYGPTGDYIYRGVDGTKTTGFELELSGWITSRWQISGGYSHNDPVDQNGQPRLTYIPKDTFKLFTTYAAVGVLDGLTVGANLRWQDEIYEIIYTNVRQGSFSVLDLMAQYKITPRLSTSLNINNVLDKRYYTDIANSGWWGTPRSTVLSVRFDY